MFDLLFKAASDSWVFGAMVAACAVIWPVTIGLLVRAEVIMHDVRKMQRLRDG